MTWIRWDCPTPHSEVVGFLSAKLGVRPVYALGHYNAMCCGFGDHRPDGRIDQVSDQMLEVWAQWSGRPGAFASAIREWCTLSSDKDHDPRELRGWWRQKALLAKQEKDRRKPDGRKTKSREGDEQGATESRAGFSGATDEDERTNERTDEKTSSSARDLAPAVRVAVAANTGLSRNARLTGFNELLPQQADQLVADWTRDGIPIELICRVVEDRCARYEPGPRGRQPSGFRYFDQAVRQAHAEASGRQQMQRSTSPVPTFRELT